MGFDHRLPRQSGTPGAHTMLQSRRTRAGAIAAAPAPPPAAAGTVRHGAIAAVRVTPDRPVRLNLALQGGGALGAFTWGVLDRLLADGRVEIDSVSGASAGTVNAVCLAAGLAEGDADRAREILTEVWTRVGQEAERLRPLAASVLAQSWMRFLSPNQLNPFNFNPLRDILAASIDFERLQRDGSVDLYVSATDAATGRPRIFTRSEITPDVVLASACLPSLHHAVRVAERHYWDGGFTNNPPIMPLVRHADAADTLIVELNRDDDPLPTQAADIQHRLSRMSFAEPFRRELEMIELAHEVAMDGYSFGGSLRRRLVHHRFHLIASGTPPGGGEVGGKIMPDRRLLQDLKARGEAAVEAWFVANLEHIGVRSTVDLAARIS